MSIEPEEIIEAGKLGFEYRTYCIEPRVSSSPDPCRGTVTLENSGYDWRYQCGKPVSLESLGKDGWRLLHVLPAVCAFAKGYHVGIFERPAAPLAERLKTHQRLDNAQETLIAHLEGCALCSDDCLDCHNYGLLKAAVAEARELLTLLGSDLARTQTTV